MLGLRDANPNALALIVSLGQQRIRDLDRLCAHRGCEIAHGLRKITVIPRHDTAPGEFIG
jgi:hypothetical protein